MNGIEDLKNRIFSKEKKETPLEDTDVAVRLVRELGCLADVIGREYEVLSPNGEVIAKIRQNPMSIKQFNILSKSVFKAIEEERKSNQSAIDKIKSKGGRRGRR